MWPEFPGRPARGLAMKQGVIPYLEAMHLVVNLKRAALSAI